MINNSQQTTPKNTWLSFPLGETPKGFSYATSVLMGHHLVVFAHGPEDNERWVVNLQDNSIQTSWGFSFGAVDDNYTLTKYGENKMVKFGGEVDKKAVNELILLTIDSFDPLTIRSEIIQDRNAPKISGHTSAIYQDCLFVFGGRNRGTDSVANNSLWCYDLKKRTWKLCETIGEDPKPKEGAKSFIINDFLYVYGGFTRVGKNRINYSELFELNFKFMKWKKIEQKDPKPGQDSEFFGRFSASLYGSTMLILKNESEEEYDKLYCCNRHDLGSWSTVDTEGFGGMKTMGNSVIYRNSLYICATKNESNNQLFLTALQLDNLPAAKSSTDGHFSSLFLSENESDVQFKIQDELIPAHKEILIQKSPYFANLFSDSPDRKIIEIEGRKEKSFKRFLQYLYCGTFEANLNETAKLLLLADQYQQEDLYLHCVNKLVKNMTSDHFCWMLDFARERDISLLKDWCMKFFQENMSFDNIIKWGGYWQSQNDSRYETENRQLIEISVDFLLKDLCKSLSKDKETVKIYEDFLVQNLSMKNIVRLSEYFMHFQLKMVNLKDAMFNFVDMHFQEVQEQGLYKKLHWFFEVPFSGWRKRQTESTISTRDCSTAIESEAESGIQLSKKEKKERKAIKRMDPSSHYNEEEMVKTGPILKKNK